MNMKTVHTALLVSLLWLAGCGGGGIIGPPPQISVTVSPITATLQVGGNQQFTARVDGTTNTAVSWGLSSPTAPAGTDLGTISSSGLYTAPLWTSSQLTVDATATSAADPSKSATATVTVQVPKQLVLLWWKSDFQTRFGGVTTDTDGNLIAGGAYTDSSTPDGLAIAASYSINSTLRWKFDNGTEKGAIGDGVALPDGSSLWAGTSGPASSTIPMLLGVTNNGQKMLESTCPTVGGFGPIARAADKIYIGFNRPPTIVVSDTSGNLDCQGAITIKDDTSAIVTSIWTNGAYLLAAGHFYSKPPGSNLDHAAFLVKIKLTNKQVVWEKDFQDMIMPHVVVVNESGADVIYYTAVLAYPNGTSDMYLLTTKLDQNGSQLTGWPQTYPNALPSVFGLGAITPDPQGGVIVTGGNCAFASYKPDGTVRWSFQQNFSVGPDFCNGATVVGNKFLYVAGSIQAATNNEKTLAASFALPH